MKRSLLALAVLMALGVGWWFWGSGAETVRRNRSTDPLVSERPAPSADTIPVTVGQDEASEGSPIIQSESGKPIEGAIVEVLTEDGWAAAGRTRADGRVTWTRRPEQGQAIRILHPRVAIGTLWNWEPGIPLRVSDGHSFSVRVLDSEGKPVPAARVRSTFIAFQRDDAGRENRQSLGWQETTTGEQGLAAFASLPKGDIEVHVRVVHALYSVRKEHWELVAGEVEIRAITLWRGAVISGRVLDIQGNVVPGAVVAVGEKRVACDEAGRYELHGVWKRASPVASKPGVGMGQYGVLGPEQPIPQPLGVELGERRTGVDIRLWPVSRIVGSIRAADDVAIESVAYAALPDLTHPDFTGELRGESASDGNFETDEFFVVRPTVIPFYITATGHSGKLVLVEVEPGRDADVGEIALHALGVIRGVVVDAEGHPLAGGYVEVANARAMVAHDGTFRVSDVPAGNWAVVRYGGRTRPDGISAPILVEDGRRAEAVRIVVAETGTITGVVKDHEGGPYAGVQVAAVPPGIPPQIDTRKWGLYMTDAQGQFRIEGLASARYRVAVVDTEGGQEQGFRIDERMKPIDVDLAGGVSEVALTILRRGRVSVRVRGVEAGQAQLLLVRLSGGIEVGGRRFWTHHSGHSSPKLVSDGESGDVVIRESGLHVMYVIPVARAVWRSDPMELEATSSVVLGEVRLSPGRRVVATVRQRDGELAAGASVRLSSGVIQTPEGGQVRQTDHAGRAVFEGIPEGDFHLLVTELGAAPLVVPLPKAGDAEIETRMTAGRGLELSIEGATERAEFLLFDAVSGRYLGRRRGLRSGPLLLPHAPEGDLHIVARIGERFVEATVGPDARAAVLR